MKKYLPLLLAAAVLCLSPALARAGDYQGVVSGDSSDDGVSVRDDGGIVLKSDYPQVKAGYDAGNAAKMKSAMEQDREAAAQAREKEAAQEKAAIDARVKDTLSQPSSYDSRINNLQASTGADGTVSPGSAGTTTTTTTGTTTTGTNTGTAGTATGGATSPTTGGTYTGGGVSNTGGAGAAGSGGYDGLIAPENNKGRAQIDLQ